MVATGQRFELERWMRRVSIGVSTGTVAGLVIGGVGGRLAMFVLRLTSSPSLHGVETDDGFTIGVFSLATVFLLVLTAAIGVLAGLVYLVIRTWLPGRWRPWLFGAFGGLVGGALLIQPDGLDFRLLEPLSLAIAFFIAIPAGCGFAISASVERRFAEADEGTQTSATWMVGLIPLVLLLVTGPSGVALAAITIGAGLVARSVPMASVIWGSTTFVWIGRLALAVIAAIASVALVQDIAEIL
ncbi:MAG TPA: hypothetical protein VNG34_13065 [Actinomycetota bacterium]|jgi:hypothetical protein|nr:hypothetical protein [Actinomycetota bacterium]